MSCAFSRKRVVVGHANLRDEVLPVELCIGTETGLGRSDTGTSSFVHHQGSHTSATGGLEADLCLYLSHLVAFSRAGNGTVWNGTTPGKEVHAATITHARFGVHYLGQRSHATWSSGCLFLSRFEKKRPQNDGRHTRCYDNMSATAFGVVFQPLRT